MKTEKHDLKIERRVSEVETAAAVISKTNKPNSNKRKIKPLKLNENIRNGTGWKNVIHTHTHSGRQRDRQLRAEYRTSVYQIRQAHLYAMHGIHSMNTIASMAHTQSRARYVFTLCLENNELNTIRYNMTSIMRE